MYGSDTIAEFGTVTIDVVAPVDVAKGDLWLDSSSIPNVLKIWDGAAWIAYAGGGGGGGGITIAATAPATPTAGDLWFDTTANQFKTWDGTAWLAQSGGSSVTVAATAPATPTSGQLWFDTTAGVNQFKVWNGTSWLSPSAGSTVTIAATAPATPTSGQLWYDTTAGVNQLKAWNGTAWVTTGAVVAATAPASPISGQMWLDTTAGQFKVWNGTAWSVSGAVAPSGTAAPTGPKVGQLWYDTTAGVNQLKAWNGTAWTAVGNTLATQAQVDAGTSTTTVITPATLRGASLAAPTSTPTNDAGKLVRLNAQGHIDSDFLGIDIMVLQGGVDVAAALPAGTHNPGDFYIHTGADGATPHASWGITDTMNTGDMLLFDGTGWFVIESNIDPTAFLMLSGGAMTDTAAITFNVPAGAAPTTQVTRLNGSDPLKSAIDNFTLDMGTY